MSMKLQDKLKMMADYSCLACCYLEMVGITDERKPFFILEGMKQGFLSEDCTVVKPIEFICLTGNENYKNVIKQTEYNEDKPVIARFVKNGYNHFVIVNGRTKKVIYNSLEKSNCVDNGVIESYRVLV